MLDSAKYSIETLVEWLHLQPHPEGDWYRGLHRSTMDVRVDDGQQRALGSSPLSEDDPHEPSQFVHVVPAGWWQTARCPGAWTLVSCCMGSDFEFEDFQLLSHQPASSHPPGALSDLL
ncbi:MAG: cupin domain-containing protein [Cyanobium sp.]